MKSQRRTIDYGIYLGTTNSAIACMKRGKPVVVKKPSRPDTTPSAVAFTGKRVLVGEGAKTLVVSDRLKVMESKAAKHSVFIEFMRTIGTDYEYELVNGERWRSEHLLAELLKELKSLVQDRDLTAAVVTIPAAFKGAQQEATKEAARLAGITQCHLLQEPVAAAMAYGLTADNTKEKWVIFDFGGDTFDSALILTDDGQISVKDTEGDNHLGGKDLDLAVIDKILIPEVMKEHDIQLYLDDPRGREIIKWLLKEMAEEINIALSYADLHEVITDLGELLLPGGEEIDLDFEITREQLRPVVAPLFQRAIDKTKTLLNRHGLGGQDIDRLILVGGPTHSPILRQMVTEQLCKPDTSVDPMTVVACGAAFYASTIELAEVDEKIDSDDDPTVALVVKYEKTTVADEEFVTIQLPEKPSAAQPESLEVAMKRLGWDSGCQRITQNDGAFFEVPLEMGPNVFEIYAANEDGSRVEVSPSEITIIQGTKLTGSPLTQDLGVALYSKDGGHKIFYHLLGAEKAKRLPVTGVISGKLKTTQTLNPGKADDRLVVRLYEDGGSGVKTGDRIELANFRQNCVLTGLDVPHLIPKGTDYDVTIVTEDSSALLEKATVFFPTLELELDLKVSPPDKKLDPAWIEEAVDEARSDIAELRGEYWVNEAEIDKVEAAIEEAYQNFVEAGDDRDVQEKAITRIREALKPLYALIDSGKWPKVKAELEKAWQELQSASVEEGTDPPPEIEREVTDVKKRKDIELAKSLVEKIKAAIFILVRYKRAQAAITYFIQNFGRHRWTNVAQAQAEVDAGLASLHAGAGYDDLVNHWLRIIKLIDCDKREIDSGGDLIMHNLLRAND